MKQRQLIKKLKKIWSGKKEDYHLSIYCDSCERHNKKIIMEPIKLPLDKELVEIIKTEFQYKRWIPLKKFKASYLLFKCPECNFKKFTKLQFIIEEGYINPEICKKCERPICDWYKCTQGGYLK